MSERVNMVIDGIRYKIFEKSIKCDVLAEPVFYNREVTKDDVYTLHRLFQLGFVRGREKAEKEINDALEGSKKVLGINGRNKGS